MYETYEFKPRVHRDSTHGSFKRRALDASRTRYFRELLSVGELKLKENEMYAYRQDLKAFARTRLRHKLFATIIFEVKSVIFWFLCVF